MSDSDRYSAHSILLDRDQVIPLVKPLDAQSRNGTINMNEEEEEDDLYAAKPKRSLTMAAQKMAERIVRPENEEGWSWLPSVSPAGDLEVRLLPH